MILDSHDVVPDQSSCRTLSDDGPQWGKLHCRALLLFLMALLVAFMSTSAVSLQTLSAGFSL